MTKSNYICTCGIDMVEYAKLFTYSPLSETTCAVTGYTGCETVTMLIPACAPDGRTVVAIGDRAFAGMTSLRAVTLPESLESIGLRAFAFCTGLLDIRFTAATPELIQKVHASATSSTSRNSTKA